MEFLGLNRIPFARVFTKSDKITLTALENSVDQYNSEMLKNWESLPVSFITSAVKGNGRDEILNYIEESMNNFSTGS
jgi:GTP-binding protein